MEKAPQDRVEALLGLLESSHGVRPVHLRSIRVGDDYKDWTIDGGVIEIFSVADSSGVASEHYGFLCYPPDQRGQYHTGKAERGFIFFNTLLRNAWNAEYETRRSRQPELKP